MTSCDCKVRRERFRVVRNGVEHWGEQCLTCGAWWSRSKSTFDSRPAEPYDEQLPEAWLSAEADEAAAHRELSKEVLDLEREDRIAERKAKYDAYLKTEKWAWKRKAVLERDGYLCQACRTRRAVQVHHLTYEHLGDEPLFELVAVCVPCHERISAWRH